jgi:hypothetical protein
LPPVVLGQLARSFGRQHVAQQEGGLDDEIPGDAIAGIEIEDQPIVMLDILDSCTPGVQLDGANLDQAQEASEMVHPQTDTFAPLALFDAQLVHGGGQRGQRTHMVEGASLDVTHELERAAPNTPERAIGNFGPGIE